MHEIKCPKCGEVFQVDESGYAELLSQVRNEAFEDELHQRARELEEKNKNDIKMAQMEQKIDDMTEDYREHQLERLKSGVCSGDACVIYSEMLTDFERLGDHMLNIAEAAAESKYISFSIAEEAKLPEGKAAVAKA